MLNVLLMQHFMITKFKEKLVLVSTALTAFTISHILGFPEHN